MQVNQILSLPHLAAVGRRKSDDRRKAAEICQFQATKPLIENHRLPTSPRRRGGGGTGRPEHQAGRPPLFASRARAAAGHGGGGLARAIGLFGVYTRTDFQETEGRRRRETEAMGRGSGGTG